MQAPTIRSIHFEDITDLPEVHSDARRTIQERITRTDNGIQRTSRSVVNAGEVVTSNHYHDFNQDFKGRGEGILYTAPKDSPANITEQALPVDGWAFTIPEGMIMALRLKKGAVQIFVSDKEYADGTNTHRAVIAS